MLSTQASVAKKKKHKGDRSVFVPKFKAHGKHAHKRALQLVDIEDKTCEEALVQIRKETREKHSGNDDGDFFCTTFVQGCTKGQFVADSAKLNCSFGCTHVFSGKGLNKNNVMRHVVSSDPTLASKHEKSSVQTCGTTKTGSFKIFLLARSKK